MRYGNFPVSGTCSGMFSGFRNVFVPEFNSFRNMFRNFLGFRNMFQNFSGFRNVFRNFSGFRNVFQNFSGFRNVIRNISVFRNQLRNNFQFPKWNNSRICSGNENWNSGFRIHISGSFRFHYGNFDPEYPSFKQFKKKVSF